MLTIAWLLCLLLTLLMLWVNANDAHDALAMNHLALVTNLLDG
jgi:hypothetical protein